MRHLVDHLLCAGPIPPKRSTLPALSTTGQSRRSSRRSATSSRRTLLCPTPRRRSTTRWVRIVASLFVLSWHCHCHPWDDFGWSRGRQFGYHAPGGRECERDRPLRRAATRLALGRKRIAFLSPEEAHGPPETDPTRLRHHKHPKRRWPSSLDAKRRWRIRANIPSFTLGRCFARRLTIVPSGIGVQLLSSHRAFRTLYDARQNAAPILEHFARGQLASKLPEAPQRARTDARVEQTSQAKVWLSRFLTPAPFCGVQTVGPPVTARLRCNTRPSQGLAAGSLALAPVGLSGKQGPPRHPRHTQPTQLWPFFPFSFNSTSYCYCL